MSISDTCHFPEWDHKAVALLVVMLGLGGIRHAEEKKVTKCSITFVTSVLLGVILIIFVCVCIL